MKDNGREKGRDVEHLKTKANPAIKINKLYCKQLAIIKQQGSDAKTVCVQKPVPTTWS